MTEVNTKYDVTKEKRLQTPVFNTDTEVGSKYDVGSSGVDPASTVSSADTQILSAGPGALPEGFVPGPGKGTNKTFTTSSVPSTYAPQPGTYDTGTEVGTQYDVDTGTDSTSTFKDDPFGRGTATADTTPTFKDDPFGRGTTDSGPASTFKDDPFGRGTSTAAPAPTFQDDPFGRGASPAVEETGTEIGTQWDVDEPVLQELPDVPELQDVGGLQGLFEQADKLEGLSEADRAEALEIFNRDGLDAFTNFIAGKLVSDVPRVSGYDADTVEAIQAAKQAYAAGGLNDFFSVADHINVLADPNATDEEKTAAKQAIQHILNNPSETAGARTIAEVITQDEALQTVLTTVEELGGQTLTDEEFDKLTEGLDENSKEIVREINTRKQDAINRSAEEYNRRMEGYMRGEGIVDDVGTGTMGGLPNPPNKQYPSGTPRETQFIDKTKWYLNQAMARARHGRYSPGWAKIVGEHAEFAGMGSKAEQIKWAEGKIKGAWDEYKRKLDAHTSRDAERVARGVTKDFNTYINERRVDLQKEKRELQVEEERKQAGVKLFDTVAKGGKVSDADLSMVDPSVAESIRQMQDRIDKMEADRLERERKEAIEREAAAIGQTVTDYTDRTTADNEARMLRYQAETKRIQDENARIMEEYRLERERINANLNQRQADFAERERQRQLGNVERERIVDKAPALATDVAMPWQEMDPVTGEFAPTLAAELQELPARVASAEDKIRKGGTLTEADVRGLPADDRDRLINLSTTATNQMQAGDLERADREVQIEARRRLLDPFTQGSGATVYGMGNAQQTFGRNVMSGLEARIAGELDNVRVNADVQRAAQKRNLNTQYDKAIERLARTFATQPDKLSGAAQRRFEELEAARADALNQVDVQVDAQVRQETRQNIDMLRGLQESREGAALRGQELGIQALREATGFAGQLTAQDMQQQGIEEQRQARLSGQALQREEMYGGEVPISMAGLGVNANIGRTDQMFQLVDRLPSVLGRAPTQEEINTLLDGGSLPGRTTLGAQMQRGQLAEATAARVAGQEIQREGLEEQRQARRSGEALQREQIYGGDAPISMANLGINPNAGRTDQMFALADRLPSVLGRAPTQDEINTLLDGGALPGRTTIAAEMQRGQLALQQEQQDLNAQIQRGDLSLRETIQKGNLAVAERGMSLQEIREFGGTPDVTMQSLTGRAGAVMAADGSYAPNVGMDELVQASEGIQNAFLQQIGRKPTSSEMTTLLKGGTVGGRQTLAAREAGLDRTHQLSMQANEQDLAREQLYGGHTTEYDRKMERVSTLAKANQDAQISIARKSQALDEKIQTGQLDNATMAIYSDVLGTVRDPETGIRVATLAGKANSRQDKEFSDSVRRFNAQFLGELTDENGDIRQGIDAKGAAAQIASTMSQIDRSERELNHNIGIAYAELTGQTGMPGPMSANDIGMDVSSLQGMNPMSWSGTEEWDRARQAIADMSGTNPTDDQLRRFLSGDQIMVNGAPTMEAKMLTTKVMQQNMDRAVQVDQIEKQFGLQKGQLDQAMAESDRQWALTTQDVAGIFGIDSGQWAESRNAYENALAAGHSPQRAASMARSVSGLSEEDFMSANNLFEERFGQAARTAAINTGISAEQWEATKEARKTVEDRESDYWNGIMENVGQDVSMSTLRNFLPMPEPGTAEFPQELSDKMDQVSKMMVSAYTKDESRLAGKSSNQIAEYEAAVRNMMIKDPEGYIDTIEAIMARDGKGNENRISQVWKEFPDVPKLAIEMFIQSNRDDSGDPLGISGKTSSLLDNPEGLVLAKMRHFSEDPLWGEYQSPTQSDDSLTTLEGIAGMLELHYDLSPDDALKHANQLRSGGSMRLAPKDWLASMDPYLRQEVLSLLHGGTSFGIAQKEPSMAQSLGGLAGGLAGAWLSGGAPGGAKIGSAIGSAGQSIFSSMFGGGGGSAGGGGYGGARLRNTGAY